MSSPSSASIEIIDLKPRQNGNVKAFCSVRIGGVVIKECKIVQQPGQTAWLSMPDRQWTGNDGKVRYFQLIELSDKLRVGVNGAAVAAWDAHQNGQ